jgi:hypothetical protein
MLLSLLTVQRESELRVEVGTLLIGSLASPLFVTSIDL